MGREYKIVVYEACEIFRCQAVNSMIFHKTRSYEFEKWN